MLSARTKGWDWTAGFSDFGLLAEEFPESALHIWELNNAALHGSSTWRRSPCGRFLEPSGSAQQYENPRPSCRRVTSEATSIAGMSVSALASFS